MSLICQDITYLYNSSIAFCMAMVHYIIDRDDASCSVIWKYVSKSSKIGTSLLGSTKLLIVLKANYSTKSGWIQKILIMTIK